MTNFSKVIGLYMRVNNVSRNQVALEMMIPPGALRRLCEGKHVKSSELLKVVAWLFSSADE